MKIETKYNFGDTVYSFQIAQKKIWGDCDFCSGKGIITGDNNNTHTCPNCYGKGGIYTWEEKKYTVGESMTIGEIRTQSRAKYKSDYSDFDNYGNQTAKYEETYMCYETGIGSGTLHPGDKLFKTVADAQIECDKLNKKE